MDTAQPSFLIILVDVVSLVNYVLSKIGAENGIAVEIAVQGQLEALSTFCTAYSLMHRQNEMALISCSSQDARMVYPDCSSVDNVSFVHALHQISGEVSKGILESTAEQLLVMGSDQVNGKGSLSQGLSIALATSNRRKELQSRVVVLQFDRDRNHTYNSVMNCVFRLAKVNRIKLQYHYLNSHKLFLV